MRLREIVLGNLLTLVILALLYLSYRIVAPYFLAFLYALLLSEALQRPKRFLVRVTRGRLGHSTTTGVLMLSALGIGGVLLLSMLTLSLQDLFAVQRTLLAEGLGHRTLLGVGLKLNSSSLEAWGFAQIVNSSLAYAQTRYVELETHYNSTPWWPLVADTMASLRSLEAEGWSGSLLSAVNVTAIGAQARELITGVMNGDEDMTDLAAYLWATLQQRQEEALQATLYLVRVGDRSLSVLWSLTSSMINLVFFLSLTVTLLALESSVLNEFVGGLCGRRDSGRSLEDELRRVSEGIFFFPVACYLGRYFYTLVVALALRLHFPFLLALLTLTQTLLPGISAYPWLSCIPWVFHLICHGMMQSSQIEFMAHPFESRIASFGLAGLLFLSQYLVLDKLEASVAHRCFQLVPSWVTGLSIVCGFEHFGLHAFFFSPLVVSLAILFFELMTEGDQLQVEDEDGRVHQEDSNQENDAPVPLTTASVNNGGVGLTGAAVGSSSAERENFADNVVRGANHSEMLQPSLLNAAGLRKRRQVAASEDWTSSDNSSVVRLSPLKRVLRRHTSAEDLHPAGYSAEDEQEDMPIEGKSSLRTQPSRKSLEKTRRLGEKLHHAFLGT
mmetsp:Transcript_31772/g.62439  ORF Transcript_31772/g.62439 Transcript_31772/m.62439 type:complete len:613 (-) Transcript_31772:148-1986(-)